MLKFPGKLKFINLYYEDSEAAVRFFRDNVGLTPMPNQSDSDDWYGFEPTGDGVSIAIEKFETLKNRPFEYNRANPVLLQFEIDGEAELQKTVDDLRTQGVQVVREPTKRDYGTIANFVDTEGNAYELICPNK